jgi:D-threo-aldose 1-dehydrogenase
MRAIVLPGTDLTVSRLAYGSAALMARLGRRESLRLLETAHECGITHFDTARSYGYGEAESAVGEFISTRRDVVTVTTKLGRLPPPASRALRTAKAIARVAVRRAPGLRPLLRRRAQALGASARFHPRDARASLETSLRELGTDVVDILLLHECHPEDLASDGLLDFMEAVVREGKVRYFGVGTDPVSTGVILRERPEFARVVQVAHSAVDRTLEDIPQLAGLAVITHSAVRRPLRRLTELMRDEARREAWSRTLGVDCGRQEVIGRLLLAYALESNPSGAVLFASTSEERIRSNAALADNGEFSSGQILEFARLMRESATTP